MATANPPRWSPAGRDVVGQAAVRPAVGLLRSAGAASAAERADVASSISDVVALGVGRPEPVDALRAVKCPSAMISSSSVLRVVEQLAGHRLVEDRRVLALQLPGEEQELPVDHRAQLGRGPASTTRTPVNGGTGRSSKDDLLAVGPRLLEGQQRRAAAGWRAARAAAPAPRGWSVSSAGGALGSSRFGHHADDPRRVEHVHGRRRRRPARSAPRCAAGTWWRRRSAAAASKPAPLHLARRRGPSRRATA